MLRATILLLLALGAATARADGPPAATATDDVTAATRHYQAGMAHFNLEEWDQAIAEFEAGYRAKPVPEFLYNLAQAYRLSKRPQKAIGFYRRFLYTLPADAPNRAEVERQIANCERDAAAQPSAPAPLSPPPVVEPTAHGAPSLTATAPRKTPLTHKAWFWGVVGGATVVVAGAVVLAVVLGTRGDGQQALPGAQF